MKDKQKAIEAIEVAAQFSDNLRWMKRSLATIIGTFEVEGESIKDFFEDPENFMQTSQEAIEKLSEVDKQLLEFEKKVEESKLLAEETEEYSEESESEEEVA